VNHAGGGKPGIVVAWLVPAATAVGVFGDRRHNVSMTDAL